MGLEMVSLVAAICPLFITALPEPLIPSNGVGTIGLPYYCYINPTPECKCDRLLQTPGSPGLGCPGLSPAYPDPSPGYPSPSPGHPSPSPGYPSPSPGYPSPSPGYPSPSPGYPSPSPGYPSPSPGYPSPSPGYPSPSPGHPSPSPGYPSPSPGYPSPSPGYPSPSPGYPSPSPGYPSPSPGYPSPSPGYPSPSPGYPGPSPGRLVAPGLNKQQQIQQFPIGAREGPLGASQQNFANREQFQDTSRPYVAGSQRLLQTSTSNTADRFRIQQGSPLANEPDNYVLPEQQLPLQQVVQYQREGSVPLATTLYNNPVDRLQQDRLGLAGASIGQQNLINQQSLEAQGLNAPVCPETPCCTNTQLANSQICLSEAQRELLRQQLQSIVGTIDLDANRQSVAVLPVVLVPLCQQAVLMPLCQPVCSFCPSEGLQQYSPTLVSPSDYTQVSPGGSHDIGTGVGFGTGPGLATAPGLATSPALAERPLYSDVSGGNRNNYYVGMNQPGISNPVYEEYLGNRQRLPGSAMPSGLQGGNAAPLGLNRWSSRSGNRPSIAQRYAGESVPAADGSSEATQPSSKASGDSENNKDVLQAIIPDAVPRAKPANAIASSKSTAHASSASNSVATAVSSSKATATSA